MVIEGPMKISIAEPADGHGKILVIGFEPSFQALEPTRQGEVFQSFLDTLSKNIAAINDPADRNRSGMLIVQQVAEQLLDPIKSGVLALEETITVQIRQESQAVALVDLLRHEG